MQALRQLKQATRLRCFYIGKAVCIACVAVICPIAALAQVQVRAEVDRNTISIQDELVLALSPLVLFVLLLD